MDDHARGPIPQAQPARRLERNSRKPTQRMIVQCDDRFESDCFRSLMELNGSQVPSGATETAAVARAAGLRMVHEFKGTNLFAIEVPEENLEEIDASIRSAPHVVSVTPDPERFVSELPGSVRILNGASQDEMVPYGVDLVRARDVWRKYGDRGGGATVCVIDTGLRADHEDLNREKLDGSNSPELVTPWVSFLPTKTLHSG